MFRRYLGLFLAVLMVSVLAGCDNKPKESTEESLRSYEFVDEGGYQCYEFGRVTLKIESGYLSNDQMMKTAAAVESAVRSSEELLSGYSRSKDRKAVMELHSGNGSTTIDDSTINVYYAENETIPYTALVTEALAGVRCADWLREGLGTYAAARNDESMMDTCAHLIEVIRELPRESVTGEGKEQVVTEIHYDLMDLASVLKQQGVYAEAAKLGDLTEAIVSIGYAEEAYNYKGAYDIYAGSFITYLVDSYGMDAVWELYSGKEFATIINANFDTVREAWWNSL